MQRKGRPVTRLGGLSCQDDVDGPASAHDAVGGDTGDATDHGALDALAVTERLTGETADAGTHASADEVAALHAGAEEGGEDERGKNEFAVHMDPHICVDDVNVAAIRSLP